MPKYAKFSGRVTADGNVKIPTKHRQAICEDLGINSLHGYILELKITVIHLKDNTQIKFE